VSAFEVVLIVVGVLGILLAATRGFRTRNTLSRLGRSPESFAHPDDAPLSERPSEDDRDEPLPKRPLRGRADWPDRDPGSAGNS
jgi:hypothetical protein